MDNVSASSAVVVGSPSEVTASPSHDDDARHGHSAIAATQVSKPMVTLSSSPVQEGSMKDAKNVGMRFHEDCHDPDSTRSPRLRLSQLFREKARDSLVMEIPRKRPLQLLDLPTDVLKEIVREVTHTNDLTSLALCHSALHRLTIPHIYSRFDIVWPDTTAHAEPRSGVDALTYGLATLVMAEEIFGEAPGQRRSLPNIGVSPLSRTRATETQIRRRRGNHYAQYTKKFSLGNGPPDWVQEYLISKEGGKMLGTLVALAIARMRALEAFIWDMPTGILHDVWNSLASLGDERRLAGQPCRLEKVWVRWHDNSLEHNSISTPPPPNMTALPTSTMQGNVLGGVLPRLHPSALDRVERPSFSQLPPLKSLSVLDIDELAYLDEMAVLVGNSVEKLRELRVGIARHAMTRDWVTVRDDDDLQQVDREFPTVGSVTIGEKRLGGVLGTLTGFVHDVRRPRIVVPKRPRPRRASSKVSASNGRSDELVEPDSGPDVIANDEADGADLAHPADPQSKLEMSSTPSGPMSQAPTGASAKPREYDDTALPTSPDAYDGSSTSSPQLANVLYLENLELERVPLSVPVMRKVIDWTRITSITLLNCLHHEQLWKALRRDFAPTPRSPTYPSPCRAPILLSPRKNSRASAVDPDFDYPLKLRKVHTSTVSSALVSFLKETLAPNSLEVLFLQEARSYNSTVDVGAIFRGPIRRHRTSLRKLMIDSSEKTADGSPVSSSRWRRWMLTRDVLAFICSAKMPQLRELGMALSYEDWHFFLQHLPSIPQLRSLYIPFLADHVHGTNVDPRELALQVVDIVVLRPEVELCYMGIANKCFEILENRLPSLASLAADDAQLGVITPGAIGSNQVVDGDLEEDEDEEIDEDNEDEGEEETESDVSEEADDDDDDDADDDDDDETSSVGADSEEAAARLRLREILFYDDKVAIFKARHGKL